MILVALWYWPCGKSECFWWLESAETLLGFACSCAECWSLWDGPVVPSCSSDCSAHSYGGIILLHCSPCLAFTAVFQKQAKCFSTACNNIENIRKFPLCILEVNLAASPASVFCNFIFLLLLISKCLQVIRNSF